MIIGYEGTSSLMSFSSTSQAFFPVVGVNNSQVGGGDEADQQIPFVAGTFSDLWCRVKSVPPLLRLLYLEKNAANGNETFSIAANTTGAFTDGSRT